MGGRRYERKKKNKINQRNGNRGKENRRQEKKKEGNRKRKELKINVGNR